MVSFQNSKKQNKKPFPAVIVKDSASAGGGVTGGLLPTSENLGHGTFCGSLHFTRGEQLNCAAVQGKMLSRPKCTNQGEVSSAGKAQPLEKGTDVADTPTRVRRRARVPSSPLPGSCGHPPSLHPTGWREAASHIPASIRERGGF